MTKVLVTGAGGFVGTELCQVLEERGLDVLPVFRDVQSDRDENTGDVKICKNVGPATNWAAELAGVDVVVHLVAKVHEIRSGDTDDLAIFRDINVAGSARLAKQAAEASVKRFVYLSSIKVNGERTVDIPFAIDQAPIPEDSYGQSKMEAEVALREIEKETGIEVVIIRPPLVYGPGVKGNLRELVGMVEKGMPLPLGAIHNRRSLVSIYNLCDLIRVCISHPAAAGNTFLVADSESISTTDLVKYLANGLGRKANLIPVPCWALKIGANLVGKSKAVEKLTGNLLIDMSRTEEVLQWHPPLTVVESFKKMFSDR